MRFKTFVILLAMALLAIASSAGSAAAWQKKSAPSKADAISGDWTTSLVSDGNTNEFTLTLKLKLDHDKVTGTYESDHIGSGNIRQGLWAANQLTLSLETNHGLIALIGELKQGKLAGKFDAGMMKGTWTANKKKPDAKPGK